VRLTREIFAQPAFDAYRGKEIEPGDAIASDEELDDWVARGAGTAYHPCGSCRMGADDMAVVDPEGRVRGIESLRVVDSSIMPCITNGNINAPTLMIGERCADLMRGRPPLSAPGIEVFVPSEWREKQRMGEPERASLAAERRG
jgi:choline dehydrogenase